MRGRGIQKKEDKMLDVLFFFVLAMIVGSAIGFRLGILYSSKKKAMDDQTICDACGKPITEDQESFGYECNLHKWCVESEDQK